MQLSLTNANTCIILLLRYPLAAVMSAENKQETEMREENATEASNCGDISQTNGISNEQECDGEDDLHDAGNRQNGGYTPASKTEKSSATVSSFQRIALTFSTQGLGFITVPLLAYPMLALDCNIDVIWRVLLGVGALPGVWVVYLRLCSGHLSNKSYDKAETDGDMMLESDCCGNVNNQDHGRAATNGNELTIDEDPANKTSQTNKTRTLELPASNKKNEDEANATDDGSPTLQDAVSTLFSDITSSDINEAIQGGENDLSLVENSHLECGATSCKNEDAAAHNNVSSMTPPMYTSHPRGL